MKLLNEEPLRTANIRACIDGNPVNRRKQLRGIPVMAPTELNGISCPIVITTTLHETEIRRDIRNLGIANRLVSLRMPEAFAGATSRTGATSLAGATSFCSTHSREQPRDPAGRLRDAEPEAAQGAHRELDRLATDALRAAARKGKRVVDRTIAVQVVGSDPSREETSRWKGRHGCASVSALSGSPEIAVLDGLGHTLRIAIAVTRALNPELATPWSTTCRMRGKAATLVLTHAESLLSALDAYRDVVNCENCIHGEDDEDRPAILIPLMLGPRPHHGDGHRSAPEPSHDHGHHHLAAPGHTLRCPSPSR